MYIFNGKKLTEDQAKKFAEETGRDLQTFLEANPDIQEDPDFGPQDELGKPEVAVEEVALAVTGDMASQLDFGLLELPNAKSETKDSTLILSEKTKEEKNEIDKSFKSVRKNIVKSLPGLAEADKENKEKRFSKGSVKKDEAEEYNNWKETGEVSYDKSIFSKENVDQLVANGEREFLENISDEDREVMLSEKEAYLKPIVKARDEGYVMINDNVKAIKQIKADFELSEEMGTPYTEEQRLSAIEQIKKLSGSVDDMYATYLTNSSLIDDESEFLDAFRRSYSNIDQLANITKTVVTDMAMGVVGTLDMLKSEEGKKKSFTNNLAGYREELQEVANTKLPKPIPVSSIRNFDDMTNWGMDAVVNFVPSGVMAFSGPAAMPLFFASGYGSRMSEFELERRQAERSIPKLEEELANTQDPNEISKIQDEIDKQNQVLSTSDLNKFLVAGIYGTAEVVTEKLTTLRLVDDLKNANTVFQTKGFGKALVEKIKEYPTAPLLEGGGEGVNAVVGNWADITILGQDKSYLEGVDEAMAQGALIGTGFKVAETGMLGKAAMLDVISDNNDKKVLKTLVDEVNQLTTDLNKTEGPTERGEILRTIRNKVKNTILEQDFTGTQFLKLTEKEQQEVFESDRKARKVNKRWAAVASSGVDEKTKEIIRKELEAEYNSHQDNKTVVLRKSDSDLKELAKVEGLKSGDFNRNYKMYTVNGGAVKRNNKLKGFANKIIGVTESEIEKIQDFVSSEEVSITLSDKSVLNKEDAAEVLETWDNGATGGFSPSTKNIYSFVERSTAGNPSTVLHEYFHAMALSKGFTKEQYEALRSDYIEMLSAKVEDGSITESQREDILARYLQEYDGSVENAEELINLTADAVNLDILKEDDVTFLQKFATNVKSIIGTILSKEEADNYSIDTAEDAWNMVQTFSQDVLSKKEGPTVVSSGEPAESQDSKIKESRSEKADLEVSADNLIKSSINEENTAIVLNPESTPAQIDKAKTALVENNQGIINNVINKNFKQGLDTNLTREEFAADIGLEVQKLINTYGKNKKTGEKAPFGVYLRDNLPLRVPAIFDKQLQTVDGNIVGKVDISKADQAIDESSEIDLDKKKEKPVKPKESLRESIPISDAVVQKVRDAVVKTFGTRLPSVESKDFKEELRKAFRTELKTTIAKDVLGTRDSYETFLRDNFEAIYEAIPQEVINKRFKAFKEPVLKKDGKQLRENTAQGNAVFKKKKISKAEFIKNFLGRDVGGSTKGTRKDALAETLAEEFAFDATPETIQTEAVAGKRERLFKDQSTEGVVEAIGRPVDLKFSLSTKQDIAFEENENVDTGHVTFEGEFEVGDTQFALKLIPLDNISDDFEAEFELKKQLEAKNIDTKELLSIEFEDFEDGLDVTGKSLEGKTSAIKTFSIVANSVLDFVKENNIKGVVFNSAEANRTRLYKAMVDRFSKELGWEYKQVKTTPVQGEVDTFVVTPEKTAKEQPTLKFSNVLIKNQDFIKTELELAAENKVWRYIAKQLGLEVLSSKNPEDVIKYRNWVKANASKFPKSFFTTGTFANAGASAAKRNFYFTSAEDLNTFLEGVEFAKEDADIAEAVNRQTYVTGGADGKISDKFKKAFNTKEFKDKQASKLRGLKKIYKIFETIIDENPSDASFVIAMLSSTSQGMGHFVRTSAPIKFYSKYLEGGIVEEHTMPASLVAKYLFSSAINKTIDKDFKDIERNYFQGALGKFDDKKLKGKKPDGKPYNYTSMTPEGWNITDNIWARYFNINVAGNNFGIDPNNIVLADGKTVFETYGISNTGALVSDQFNNDQQKASVNNNKNLPTGLRVEDSKSMPSVLSKTKVIDENSVKEEIKLSKALNLDKDFNDIIENKTGIASDKTYARVKAEVAGASKGKFNFFIPPSAEDFVGLLYSTLGKGSTGDAQMAWYKAHLLNPFARAMENLANDRANMMQDFRALKKSLKIVPKNLRKKIKDSDFTQEQAVRAYIWDKQGMEIPGLSQKDQQALVEFIEADVNLKSFAGELIAINKGDAYAAPDAGWVAGSIDTDFIKALNTTKRSKYLEVWQQNADQIFSEANLNKLEAAYGANYREAMVDMLKRMKTGKNTSSGSDRLAARFTDWLTNSVGAIMFFNTRSAVLQTISAVNFINFSDNNVLKASAAFANQPQYWKDFKKLFNSPFLLDRRSGLKLNVNEADIADMAKGPGNSARNVIAGILKAGFLPTQLADSFAIASGGASFYRNRIKALQKEGLTEAEAEEVAFRDFREIAEESQQSSRPDKISQQQAGPLGRVVLAFANTPAQYARLIKKAASDLKNGRGDAKTNISKIIYYGVAQNLLFSALQQALFAIAFDDEEEEEKKNEKYFNIVNGMSDSVLRGIGVGGAIVSVVKNTALRLAKEADKKSPKYQDAVVKGVLQISPPVSSKVGKLQSAGRSFSWNQEEMRTRGWSIDNPAYLASANVISAATNVPLDRAVKKITNIVDASNEDIEYYKRVALALGWSAWELGIDKKGGKIAPPKTNMDKLYDLNKKEQIDSLLSLGLSKKQIKLLKLEEDRVKAILDPKSIKKIKVSKRDSLFGLNKKDQVKALEKLGLTKKEIRALRLESDRVEAIINKQKQKN